MNQRPPDPLDEALASLPRDVQPGRDLWAGISAEISASSPVAHHSSLSASRRRFVASSPYFRIAAGFLLVVASSITTYVVTQRAAQQDVLQARQAAATQLQQAPALPAMPASFGGQEPMSAEYLRARATLDAQFQREVATLPPVARARLERNLADLRSAASEISATLAEHPSNSLLQELLMSTYQSELALLGGIGDMTAPALNQAETRL